LVVQKRCGWRSSLNELAKILTADNADLYEKLVKDLGETGTKFQNWWDRMADKSMKSA
jgi:CXXX repeat modification system protein